MSAVIIPNSLSLKALVLQLQSQQVTPKIFCEVRYLIGGKYIGEHEITFVYNNTLELKSLDHEDFRPMYIPNPLSNLETIWANNNDAVSLDGRITVTILESHKPIYHLTFRYEGQTYDR